MTNPFFKNHGPFTISEIIKSLKIDIDNLDKDKTITDIKDLFSQLKKLNFFTQKNINTLQIKLKHLFV